MNEIKIFYSPEDEGYIVLKSDEPRCSAFGETIEQAIAEFEIGHALWMETKKEMEKY